MAAVSVKRSVVAMTKFTLPEAEGSLPPRLLSADGVGI